MSSDFREWTLDKIDEAFGLEQVKMLPVLSELMNYSHQVDDYERRYLTDLQNIFFLGGDDWNETELENKFISPLIIFSGIDNRRFAYFLEREMAVTIGDYEISGKVDGMIATGFGSPKKPYFCLNENKRGTDPNGDPKGKALIAMLAAQQINANGKPIFGCFIIGKLWQFMALVGTEYAISSGYTCDSDDLFTIFQILKGLRWNIEQLID